MGATGSYTSKATINPLLFPFTKWGEREIEEFRLRGQLELSDTFALKRKEFEFLISRELVNFVTMKKLFEDIFDQNNNKVVDKFEVMCAICLLSKLTNIQKVHFLFDMFNFNNKGYLVEPEVSLLLLSVTNGASKVDPKFIPPPKSILFTLVQTALTFGASDNYQSIRKPELVSFTSDVVDVNSYLEAWTGYAGQVLLRKGTCWRDPEFHSNETAICPHKDWIFSGLPPPNFVSWTRLIDIQPGTGSTSLFTHLTNYLKTVDRRIIYEGKGCIAEGYLKQGLLADKWFLNSLAICSSNPFLIKSLFTLTGQEREGRYCTKVYDGFRWITVFVDDRIPCSFSRLPLFCKSSDPEESWPMILEKGIAKYFGSYGHIGSAASRVDAILFGIRMLTGGHVMKMHTRDFIWQSARDKEDAEAQLQEDGILLLADLMKEGSIVAFGKSELLSVSRENPIPGSADLGFLFPVVGREDIDGFVHYHLRDAWNIVVNENIGVSTLNRDTGHCRGFRIAAEEIPSRYDTIIICRFPDSLREHTASMRLKSWKTSVTGQRTLGRHNPAHFQLNVTGKLKEKVVASVYDKVDKAEKSKKKASHGGSNARTETAKTAEAEIITNEQVDFAFTFSSACDWIIASSAVANPKLRVRIMKTSAEENSHFYQSGEKHHKSKHSKTERKLHEESMASGVSQEPSQIIAASAEPSVDNLSSASQLKSPSKTEESHDMASKSNSTPQVDEQIIELGVNTCWISFSLKLMPGLYDIYVDIEFSQAERDMLRLLRPEPIVEDVTTKTTRSGVEETPVTRVLFQLSSAGLFDIRSISREESVTKRLQVGNLERLSIQPNVWPFTIESQQEVASRALLSMFSQFKEESELLAVRFIALVKKYKSMGKEIRFHLYDEV